MEKLTATPKATLVDENVWVKVERLKAGQKVSLVSSTVTESCDKYECVAHYQADGHGTIDMATSASKGGYYTGVETMGLFWAMREAEENERKCTRLVKKNCLTPLLVQIQVYESWLEAKELKSCKPLDSIVVERWYSRNVERHEVVVGRIRGVIYVPKQPHKMKGIIDLFGIAGGIMEFRASMLASRGFLTLALAIYGYEDLPELLPFIDLDYFEEAVEYLSSHPKCIGGGVGVIGTSMGGSIANAMATYIPKVNCAVIVNGPIYSNLLEIKYRGYLIKALETNMNNTKYMEEFDMYNFTKFFVYPKENSLKKGLIEFYKSDSAFLFLMSLNDGVLQNKKAAKRLTKVWNENSAGSCKMLMCQGAGHLLELPNTPLCKGIYLKPFRANVFYGGELEPHARAQVDSWKKTLEFFSKEILKSSKL